MKHTTNSQLHEFLRERELELFAIRRSYDELRDKFLQLENAFGINLRGQILLENELELLKHGGVPDKSTKHFSNEMESENSQTRTKLRSSVTKIRAEKKRWKEAFLLQRKITESQKLKHSQSINKMRDECENILRTCRETGEKYFRELLELYENSREKAKLLDDDLKGAQARESSTRDRVLELANLFETLEKFDGVRNGILCQRSAEALRSLVTVGVESYEKEMTKLRRVTWDIRENCEDHESLEFLKAQNSVLRQVVKSLKRKEEVNRAEEKSHRLPKINCNSQDNFDDTGSDENEIYEKSREHFTILVDEENQENQENFPVNRIGSKEAQDGKKLTSRSSQTCGFPTCSTEAIAPNTEETYRQDKQFGNPVSKRIYVDAIESHRNGVPCNEYIIDLFDDRQLRVRHCSATARNDSILLVEFVDTEDDFNEAPLDRMVLYLGDRVKTVLKVEKSVEHCGMQTRKVKKFEKSVQTSATGINRFSRVNAGVAMLNSEERAIKRSLVSLERTLSTLKEKALEEARSMIGGDVKILSNEFFECVERLKS